MNYKYIIFDYGGTLDTLGVHWGSLIWYAYRENHVPVSDSEFFSAYVFAERALGKGGIILSEDTFLVTLQKKIALQLSYLDANGLLHLEATAMDALHNKLVSRLYSYATDTVRNNIAVIDELRQKGSRTALVSNFYGNIRAVLREMHLCTLFETVTESAEVNIRKPDSAIYALAMDTMGIKDRGEVLVVGDSLKNDIIPASSLGAHTAWLHTHDSRFTPSLFDKPYTLSPGVPTLEIDNLSQLL